MKTNQGIQQAGQIVASGIPWMMHGERLPQYFRHDRFSMMRSPQQGFLEDFLKRQEKIEPEMIGDTAVIPICGVIEYKLSLMGWYFGGTSTRAVEQAFQMCVDNPDVSRIVLLIDSPGGDPIGLPECTRRIFDQREAKPVVAISDPWCASAALWYGCAAGRFVSLASGYVGSLGTMAVLTSYAEMYKMAGVHEEVIHNPEAKGEWIQSQEISEGYRQHTQQLVDDMTKQFVATIAKYRGVSVSHASEKFGQGRMLTAKQAKEAGLIDDLIQSVPAEISKTKRRGSSKTVARNESNSLALVRAAAI